jgi:hypothetical protein
VRSCKQIAEKRRAWRICTVKERIRPYLVGDVECLNAWVKTNECLLVTGGAVERQRQQSEQKVDKRHYNIYDKEKK